MAEGLLEEGCEVVIVGSSEGVHRVAEEFRSRGFACHGVQADLGSREQTLACFHSCMELLGGDLDILVNAHGIQRRHQPEDFPLSDWDDVISVNLSSRVCTLPGSRPGHAAQGPGQDHQHRLHDLLLRRTNHSGLCCLQGRHCPADKALSNDWAGKGIQINAIAPGYMATDMNTALMDPANPRCQQITDRIPAHRWGTPDDMKGICVFLASPASDYITGAVIPVDGGYLVK